MDPVRAAQPTADKLRREVRALRDGEASSINDRQCVALAARIAVEVAGRTGCEAKALAGLPVMLTPLMKADSNHG